MRWRDEPMVQALPPVERFLGGLEAPAAQRLVTLLAPRSPVIALTGEALSAAARHVAGSPLERGGLLVGQPFVHRADLPEIALVRVRAAIPSTDDAAGPLWLRMQASVWNLARAAVEPGELVVGWFHSHPGIGAFFSDTDRRTQAGFFNHAYSVGWVIDPLHDEQAWFVGAASDPVERSRIVQV